MLLAGVASGGTSPAGSAELIVGLRPGVTETQSRLLAQSVGALAGRGLRGTSSRVVRVDRRNLDEALDRLRRNPRVAFAEPNHRVHAHATPNDPSFSQLWGLVNTGQTVDGFNGTPDADIDADAAWDVTTGNPAVVVAVIDTGVDFSHPDLAGRRWTNPGESGGGRETNGVDDDGNGYVDDFRGWDFVNNDNNPQDDNDHGTHVAGTIGAVGNNATGVTGVNWNVRIMALKFLNAAGNGDVADGIEAIRYASAMGARVQNNSWGGGPFSQALHNAVADADTRGSLFVASAGNSGFDNDVTPQYPASIDLPNVLSVAASNQDDNFPAFSNRGTKSVDLSAPGVNVYSTVLGGGYAWFDGTSMAAPHVSGVAALAAGHFTGATGIGLKALLLRTVDAKPSLAQTATGGRLNAGRALACSAAPRAWLESPRPGFTARVGEALPVRLLASNCAAASGATATVTVNGAPLGLTARGDGLYTGTFVPSGSGPVTITGTALAGGSSEASSATGVVEEGYELREEPFTWLDATAGGTRLTLGDDASATLALPFSFRYFGQSYTSVAVSSNGYLVLGGSAATSYRNTAMPNTGAPNGVVAPYWDDLNPAAAGAVWHRVLGTAPNRKLVVSWLGVRHYAVAGPVTFQAVLEEGSNAIVFAYQDTLHDSSAYNHGASATVGIESATGGQGVLFSHNQARLAPYQLTTALRFAPAGPADTQPPEAPRGLTATPGELRASLAWTSNDETDLAGYHVYRENDDSMWTRVATTTGPAYTDSGLSPDAPRTYRVTAFDRASPPNESEPSAEASATPNPDLTPPAVPSGLVATAGNAQVSLDWADNADAVANYRVYRDGTAVATIAPSAYVDTGLANGTLYRYQVTALDEHGNESALSGEATATPQPPPPPPTDGPYRLLEEAFSWVDAADGGTRLTLADDASATVPLPFTFRFYGQDFTSVAVSSNGYLVLGPSAATTYRNTAIPNTAAPNGLVSPYWDDLNPSAAGGVWHRTVGTAPNRRFVVSWIGVRHYTVPGTITFQAVLEESGDLVFAYQDTLHDSPTYNHGASATVGIESPSGSAGVSFSHNQARLGPYQGTTALRFTNR